MNHSLSTDRTKRIMYQKGVTLKLNKACTIIVRVLNIKIMVEIYNYKHGHDAEDIHFVIY